jgi:excinuclease ABC subunit C
VRSYFQASSSDERAFIPWLRREVFDIETVLTGTEKEAAILENNLIKEYRPKYNVKLRDDKEFLCLRLDESKPFPRLELVRRPESDGHSHNFGPYPSATAARRTLHLVERHFQLRSCTDRELKSRQRPCMQYQIKRCPAPCVYEVDDESYRAQVRAVTLFLLGRHDAVTELLETRMRAASAELDFEAAGVLRDQLKAIAEVRDVDVLGLYREGELVELVLLVVRSGRLLDVQRVSRVRADVDDAEVVAAFLRERYQGGVSFGESMADELWLPLLPEGADGIEEWLNESAASSEGRKRKIRLVVPQRGPKSELIRLAAENAKHAFEEKRRSEEDIDARLGRLQSKLRLPKLPRRIECVDISHLGGQDAIGGVVALLDGKPDKARYRTYRVTPETPGDDYAAIFEVLSRRFLRGVKAKGSENESSDATKWDLPDLFVVDGGRGQLAVALTAAADLGITDLPIVGLAKEKESPTGVKLVDRVYLPGQKNPIALRGGSPELHFMALVRDEAHRFSNRGREKLGRARRLKSTLDDVPGIGPVTRKALLIAFGSVDAIRNASDEALLAVPGVSRRQVKAIREHWENPDGESVTDEEETPVGDPETD